ncbi:RNA polymerase RpoE-like sigma-24 subunit [Hydrogenispora ethanolica]|jgi:RNA polymerase sigma-70 factor (ECF subfamily)|uniref:RNA polymerase RpoE-like sigma-24 subunit n=1 Tax=Hydrogenispora ethanolica TaxID=1082276 RepID=A0A4V2QET7_HYDET|nr:sigma-70 family RNA polymerase sigma factor [Hydrogenispora ethanolica]TCL69307.1 RNA polymerase RpoE-like sigma-24 subunit [Hydrogenispora ethanolica]
MAELNVELIAKAKQGDPQAIEELIGKVRKPLHHFACNFLGNEFEAEDVTQEVLLKVTRALPTFKGDSTIWTWLFRIMTNACIDYQRKCASRPVSYLTRAGAEDEEAVTIELKDHRQIPEESYEQTELHATIHGALNQLSAEHRTIVILHDIYSFKYQEIAAITKTGLGTVKSRLFYARQELRKILGPLLMNEKKE